MSFKTPQYIIYHQKIHALKIPHYAQICHIKYECICITYILPNIPHKTNVNK